MVHTLQDIRGGGGSIKLGTTALMSREIEAKESALKVVPSLSTLASVSAAGDEACKTLKSETSAGEASSNSSVKNHICPETPRLKSNDITVDGTPTMKKPVKKHSCVVDIVDIKCGNPNKIWVNPVKKHRLKKFGFLKLSDSVA